MTADTPDSTPDSTPDDTPEEVPGCAVALVGTVLVLGCVRYVLAHAAVTAVTGRTGG